MQLGEEDPGYDLALVLNSINNPQEQKAVEPVDDEGDEGEDLEHNEAKESELGKLVSAGKYEELITKGFLGSLDKIMSLEDVDSIDTAFSLAFALLHNLDKTQSSTFISTLCTRLSDASTKATNTTMKLNLLCVMFNLLDTEDLLRKDVFMVLLNFALNTENGSAVIGQLRLVPNWIVAWKLTGEEEANLYLLISQLCEQGEQPILAQSYLVKYLNTISTSDNSAVSAHAARAAVAAIRSFSENPMEHPQYDCDRIRKIPAVTALKGDKVHGATYSLLLIFATDTVAEYLELVKQHPKLCGDLGLDHDLNLQKLRTLTICSLGMEHERLSYDTLIDKLKVESKEEVESVIIDAVMAGRVDAKIDQETEQVLIQRTTQRIFNKEDWKTIGNKLDVWKTNVHNVLATLHHAHAQMMANAEEQ